MELHYSFFRLQGQANDFKIQYNSIVRLFVLPKVLFFPQRKQIMSILGLSKVDSYSVIYYVVASNFLLFF